MTPANYEIRQYATPDMRDVIYYKWIQDSVFTANQKRDPDCYQYCVTEDECNPDFKLVYVGAPIKGQRKMYYAADRQEQGKYNLQYTGVNPLSGGKYASYQRTYVIKREDWVPNSIAAGADDPDPLGRDGLPVADYSFVGEVMRRSSVKELDACYVFVTYYYAKLCPITGTRLDSETGELISYTTELKPKSENPVSSPPDGAGNYTTVRDVNCEWTECRTDRDVDPSQVKTYDTYINYRWPAVLDRVEEMTWYRLDRTPFLVMRPVWKRRAQTVPTRATIERRYHASSPDITTLPTPKNFLPNAIQYIAPQFRVNIPPCLHKQESFVSDYGTNNPVWDFVVGSTRVYEETKFTDGSPAPDWPTTSFVTSVNVRPYKTGYISDTVIIHPII